MQVYVFICMCMYLVFVNEYVYVYCMCTGMCMCTKYNSQYRHHTGQKIYGNVCTHAHMHVLGLMSHEGAASKLAASM